MYPTESVMMNILSATTMNASQTELVLALVTAAIMTDLAGLDDVPDGTSPRVMIHDSRPKQFNPFSSSASETEYQSSKNHFYVLTG
ncbi:unnamed protein product [Dibothriocephalus latus]|uniref:Uncharacterized protein n=1 Tax=Dibothriocephalus latus TaxID=60516 RepID=A0A3P7NE12_DIBLA|nr:unnamed protein product [Dibothriocephalus latus]